VTPLELLATVGGLIGGYLIVNRFLQKDEQSPQEQWRAQEQAARERDESRARTRQARDEPAKPSWWQVLGVRPDATREEIVAAYKRRISEYHPDKTQRLGAEIQAQAEQRSKEINAAYDEALKRVG